MFLKISLNVLQSTFLPIFVSFDYFLFFIQCSQQFSLIMVCILVFRHNVVPIVMGARPEDYLALAPPGSYIHVNSFSGPRELAQYLKVLAANSTLYNEYFEWKKTWSAFGDNYYCRLCMMLHLRDDIGYFTWYEDYHKWWSNVCGTSSLYSSSYVVLTNAVLTFFVVSMLHRHAV